MSLVPFFGIPITAILVWVVLAGYFVVAKDLSRVLFVVLHYLTSFVATFVMFFIYSRFFATLDPFKSMIVGMVTLFVVEILFFNFLYKEELWFLNFVDWIVPVFIISSTIYLTVKFFGA